MIKTDILIIGAGPVGLFTVFEAGLLKLRCHLIDALAQPGGQCSEIYPKKPIYDIPGLPEVLAGDLTKNLLEQCKQFEPGFTLGERAESIDKIKIICCHEEIAFSKTPNVNLIKTVIAAILGTIAKIAVTGVGDPS